MIKVIITEPPEIPDGIEIFDPLPSQTINAVRQLLLRQDATIRCFRYAALATIELLVPPAELLIIDADGEPSNITKTADSRLFLTIYDAQVKRALGLDWKKEFDNGA